ncbi:MAG TPA: carboxypeptidase-like regulatory domain-containing protein [Gemmatimonadaceae bacterium]|nr:carboxypeptidase-like regulatory domain-containing protein [Gemmatimonadaceae bacterium]
MAARYRAIVLALLVVSACHRRTSTDMMLVTGRCTTHVRSKVAPAQLPHAPSLRPGVGGVVGTLADSGGALAHFSILAVTPGDPPNAAHATTMADSLGGFVFDSLTPGRYRLFVRAFAHRPDSTEVDVSAGRVDTVALRPIYFQCVR